MARLTIFALTALVMGMWLMNVRYADLTRALASFSERHRPTIPT